jgi:hypothetical protein
MCNYAARQGGPVGRVQQQVMRSKRFGTFVPLRLSLAIVGWAVMAGVAPRLTIGRLLKIPLSP